MVKDTKIEILLAMINALWDSWKIWTYLKWILLESWNNEKIINSFYELCLNRIWVIQEQEEQCNIREAYIALNKYIDEDRGIQEVELQKIETIINNW